MSFIAWNDSLSVKVEKFDNQHKRLIKLINDLYDAMMAGKGKDMLGSTLAGLVDYVKTHFADEEVEMKKYAYPKLELHLSEHKKLADQVLEFQKQYQSGEKYISIDILTFLKDWLVNHIMGTDKKYGDFYKDKNIVIK